MRWRSKGTHVFVSLCSAGERVCVYTLTSLSGLSCSSVVPLWWGLRCEEEGDLWEGGDLFLFFTCPHNTTYSQTQVRSLCGCSCSHTQQLCDSWWKFSHSVAFTYSDKPERFQSADYLKEHSCPESNVREHNISLAENAHWQAHIFSLALIWKQC